MTTLYLLRHAHAGDPAKWTGDDAIRPLSERGRRQAERVAKLLASAEDAPDIIITSPRTRAAETAEIVGKQLKIEVVVDRRLVGPLNPDTVAQILAGAGAAVRPCLVGHDPDFSELLGELTGASAVQMKKGSLARVDYEGNAPIPGRGVLRFLVPPEILGPR